MSKEILLGHVIPSMIDLMGHIAVALFFIGWWILRYAGNEDAAARSEAIPLLTSPPPSPAPEDAPKRRRFSLSALILVIVAIVGTALPLWTARLAFQAPVNATAPPAIAGTEGE